MQMSQSKCLENTCSRLQITEEGIKIRRKIFSFINSRRLSRENDPRVHILIGRGKHSLCEVVKQHDSLIAATPSFG